jgi:hypothetical protein
VNFAVSTGIILNFLGANGIAILPQIDGAKLDSEELASTTKSFTVQVICEKTPQRNANR